MSRFTTIALALSLFLVRPSGALLAQAPGPTPAPPQRVPADTPTSTSAGTTFTMPTDWAITRKSTLIVLDPPESGSHLALVDVASKEAKDADAAVAAAWAAYRGNRSTLNSL